MAATVPAALARRVSMAAALFAGACPLLTCAAQIVTVDEPIDATTYAVGGTVENSLTHEPIARALVEANTEAVLTDSNGRFELHLPSSVTGITVRRPGYDNGEAGMRGPQHFVNVGPNMPPLIFYLTPSAGIAGHVTLSSGDAPGGLQFMLYRKRIENGRSRWEQVGMAAIRIDGSFQLPSLEAPASYLLCNMESPDRTLAMRRGETASGYPGACYPGGADLVSAAAAPLKLAPGQQAQIEVSLAKQPFYPVSISMANDAAHPTRLQIFERSGRPMGFGMRRNERNGSYEVGLPNGSYYAEVSAWGPPQLYGRVDFTVAGAPLSGLTIVPAPMQPIGVEIQREFTANPDQIPGFAFNNAVANVERRDARPNIGLAWIPVNKPLEGQIGANLRPADPSSESGLYLVDPPSQGTYWLEASGFDSYVSSMTSGGADLVSEPLVIGPGNNVQPIKITLRNDVGSLRWKLKTPLTGTSAGGSSAGEQHEVFFYAISLSADPRRIREARFQTQTAAVTFMNQAAVPGTNLVPLPPGKYLAAAFSQQREIDLSDSEEMSRLAARGQTVTIEPGTVTDVQLDPIDADGEEASE